MDELDSIMGEFEQNFTNVVEKNAIGTCVKCKSVIGQGEDSCQALGGFYHAACFTCLDCGSALKEIGFYPFTIDNVQHAVCEQHYLERTCDRCDVCKQIIKDAILKAFGKSFHPACFTCATCSKCLDGQQYYATEEEKAYCEPCWQDKFLHKCGVCKKPIVADGTETYCLKALDMRFHPKCYVCQVCNVPFSNDEGKGAFKHGEQLLCKSHFMEAAAAQGN
eukprot:Colp12_sorted_trinity150504_noHs@14431